MNPKLDPLLAWYRANRRDLPWRAAAPDPYAVWVSEIMLQQTGVSTVIPYWERWMARFPTVDILAAADEEEVLRYWQGLGYYRRARMLLAGAKFVAAKNPRSREAWLDLPLSAIPGVGRYTLGAIASIALDAPYPLVDGNVERVYARLMRDATPKPTAAAWQWAEAELRSEAPGDWNQALMELGAMICRPRNPDCPRCPVRDACLAHQAGDQNDLPKPAAKPTVLRVDLVARVAADDSEKPRYAMVKNQPGQWWHGLWTFPLTRIQPEAIPSDAIDVIRTVVTHHRVTVHLVHSPPPPDAVWFALEEAAQLPVPRWQRCILEKMATNPSLFMLRQR